MRRGVYQFDNKIWTETRIYFAFAQGQFDIRQTIPAMPELSRDELLK